VLINRRASLPTNGLVSSRESYDGASWSVREPLAQKMLDKLSQLHDPPDFRSTAGRGVSPIRSATTMTDSESTVIAVFKTAADAHKAIEDLHAHGWRDDQISFITRGVENDLVEANPSKHGDVMEKSAAWGAAGGAALGLLAGSSLLMIPGLGPIFFAGAMASGITGGLVGGLVGAMGGWGVKEDHIRQYEKSLAAGKALVLLRGSPSALAEGRALLLATPAEKVTIHAENADSDVVDA
jgi:hypothetical protein